MKQIRIKTSKGFRMFSQAKAAKQIGISEAHLSLLLRGKRKPGVEIYFKLKAAGLNLWSKTPNQS
jgi:transcriptional regulator with XRE-family HTH domain